MKRITKLTSALLCAVLVFLLLPLGISASEGGFESFSVEVISSEFAYDTVTVYVQDSGKCYMDIKDIARYTRSEVSISGDTATLTHGVRIMKLTSSGDAIGEFGRTQSIDTCDWNGHFLVHASPMLEYLGAVTGMKGSRLVISMPTVTVWEAVEKTGHESFIDINDAYGSDFTVGWRLFFDTALLVMDSGVGTAFGAKKYDALLAALEVQGMQYDTYYDEKAENDYKFSNLYGKLTEKRDLSSTINELIQTPTDVIGGMVADYALGELSDALDKGIDVKNNTIALMTSDFGGYTASVIMSGVSELAAVYKCAEDSFALLEVAKEYLGDDSAFKSALDKAAKRLESRESAISDTLWSAGMSELLKETLEECMDKGEEILYDKLADKAFFKAVGKSMGSKLFGSLTTSLDISVWLHKLFAGENSAFNYSEAEVNSIYLLKLQSELESAISRLYSELASARGEKADLIEDYRLLHVLYYKVLIAENIQFENMIVAQWGKENRPEMREFISDLRAHSEAYAGKLYMLCAADTSAVPLMKTATSTSPWDGKLEPSPDTGGADDPLPGGEISLIGRIIDTPFYTLTVPEGWTGLFVLETGGAGNEYSVSIRERVSVNEDYPGYVFSLYVKKAGWLDSSNAPGSQILQVFSTGSESYELILTTPTDFDVAPGGVDNYQYMQGGMSDALDTLVLKVGDSGSGGSGTDVEGEVTYEIIDGEVIVTGLVNADATTVTVPERIEGYPVTQIDRLAFYDNTSIREVFLPDTVKTIGAAAFLGCSSLSVCDLPHGLQRIEDNAFQASALYKVVIPDSVTYIGESAFAECFRLVYLELGESVDVIGSGAFVSCFKLVEVCNRSECIIGVGSEAFGCAAAYAKRVISDPADSFITVEDDFIFYDDEEVPLLIGAVSISGELILPRSYQRRSYEVYDYAFYSDDRISHLRVPEGILLDDFAFACCSSLESVYVEGGCTLGNDLFNTCQSLLYFVVCDGNYQIGENIVGGCLKFKSVYAYSDDSDKVVYTLGEDNEEFGWVTFYHFSEFRPTESGNYWRYVDGVPKPW